MTPEPFRLFLAGLYTSNFDLDGRLYSRCNENEQYQRRYAKHLLESYHYVNRQSYVDRMRKDKAKVFLDSGAFSAWSKGVSIDLPDYCRYIQENKDILLEVDGDIWASVLDAIGDADKTFENQKRMEKLGVRPLPCYHFGEDIRFGQFYASNYTSMTIGGLVGRTDREVIPWLDMIWEKCLLDGSGKPKSRIHGFGLTRPDLMRRYPWFSTDSSSWVQIAAAGGVLLLPDAKVVSVSTQSPNRKKENQHITTIPEIMRDAVHLKLRNYGGEPERLEKEYLSRWSYNIYAYTLLGEAVAKEKALGQAPLPQQGLF